MSALHPAMQAALAPFMPALWTAALPDALRPVFQPVAADPRDDLLLVEDDADDADEGDEDLICISCSGSGEGMYDGTRCHACKGSGVERA